MLVTGVGTTERDRIADILVDLSDRMAKSPEFAQSAQEGIRELAMAIRGGLFERTGPYMSLPDKREPPPGWEVVERGNRTWARMISSSVPTTDEPSPTPKTCEPLAFVGDAPTVPGAYWMRSQRPAPGEATIDLVLVERDRQVLICGSARVVDLAVLSQEGTEWAGPLQQIRSE